MPFLRKNLVNMPMLISVGAVKPGILEDKLGNTVTLNNDGTITINHKLENLSLNKAASLHNFLVNNADQKKNGWTYWFTYINGERVRIDKIKDIVHKQYVIDVIEKMLADI